MPVAVCFHGLLRTGIAMRPVRACLLRAGWRHVALPTSRYELTDLAQLGAWAAQKVREASTQVGGGKVDIVTHSMGGLVLRASLVHTPPIRRVVMLSPPNQGAEMAEQVRRLLPLHRVGWDPLAPLLPGVPLGLPIPPGGLEVGVLVGSKQSGGAGYNPFLGADNDGKVRVDEARLDGATDFREVQARHSTIMAQRDVLELVVRFLRSGSFEPGAEASEPEVG